MRNDSDSQRDHSMKSSRPYVTPSLKKVPLRPEEAVLGGCKLTTAAGPLQSPCSSPQNCNALQS